MNKKIECPIEDEVVENCLNYAKRRAIPSLEELEETYT